MTVSNETQISDLGNQVMVPFTKTNYTSRANPSTKTAFLEEAFYFKKWGATLSLLCFSHKSIMKLKTNSLIKFLSPLMLQCSNCRNLFNTTHRESSCLKRNLSGGFPSLVYHTCSSGISLWGGNTRTALLSDSPSSLGGLPKPVPARMHQGQCALYLYLPKDPAQTLSSNHFKSRKTLFKQILYFLQTLQIFGKCLKKICIFASKILIIIIPI